MTLRPDRPPSRLPLADLLALAALLAWGALAVWRSELVARSLGAYLGCAGCLRAPALVHELWLMAALPAALLLARWSRSRIAAALLALAVGVLVLAVVADVFVQQLLSRRLMLVDVLRYGGDTGGNWSVLQPHLATHEGALLLAVSLLVLLGTVSAIAAAPAASRRRGAKAWTLALAGMLSTAAFTTPLWYMNRAAFENVIATNLPDGMARPYGEATLQRLRDTPPPPPTCVPGRGERRNVIVLVVESWSLRHSALFNDGLADLTPRIDAHARRGSWYPQFRSNGFSTETGLAALLTGAEPLSGIRYGTVALFTDTLHDFHRERRRAGWDVRFITSGDVESTWRREWLRRIGIDAVEGDAHPFYAGLPRGAFHAADDAALLRRTLQWYDDERDPAQPFMATVLTVGMHPPFVALDGGETGEAAAVRRTDAAVGDFIDGLDARGFFEDGLLFVVGDHRVMQPVGADELARFGDDTLVRVPAFALGASGTPPGPVPGDFQQTDLLPSLQAMLTQGEACRSALHGELFGPAPAPARAQVFADPMRYDQVRARVGGGNFLLVLDGDDSRWVGAAPDPGFDLALEVARLRVTRDKPPAQ
ncbi:sulfatase-like hydrolase/transferase [Arenimonas composti]|uniref:Sulfatase N-terminal domain-containing protein n=1 Tax=Arenimonas composti TR7-09 = DSM 18010 TaxID=1121013 RepID=A0A091BD89_9GAMM|nr:sulfatase-like hydrolase/transferase [Arenimonas composti]KFN50648.1 hypothetical protein P873_05670 [Arenimonas composti TR7-09 = DSM 18010]